MPRSQLRSVMAILLLSLWALGVVLALRIDAALELPRLLRALACAGILAVGVMVLAGLRGASVPPRRIWSVGVLACSLTGLSVYFLPEARASMTRLFAPWTQTPTATPRFRIQHSSAELVASRGETITITAYLERLDGHSTLPTTGEWVYTPNIGESLRLPTESDAAGVFTFQRPAIHSGRCFLQVGGVASEGVRVEVVEPLNLLQATEVVLHPPVYAKHRVPVTRHLGMPTKLQTLAGSYLEARLHWDRRPTSLTATWRPTRGDPAILPIDSAPGIVSVVRGSVSGPGQVVLESPSARRRWVIEIEVSPDTPPQFLQTPGLTATKLEAKPTDRWPLEVTLDDDTGIARLEWEYRSKLDGPFQREALPFSGWSRTTRRVNLVLPIAGKAVEGETLQARLMAIDDHGQEATFPKQKPLEIRMNSQAVPIGEQIAREREATITRLGQSGLTQLGQARDQLTPLADAPAGPLRFDQRVRIQEALKSLGEFGKSQAEIQHQIEGQPEFRGLVESIHQDFSKLTEAITKSIQATDPGDWRPTTQKLREAITNAQAAWQTLPEITKLATQDRLAVQALRLFAAEVGAKPWPTTATEIQPLPNQFAGLLGTQESLRQSLLAAAIAEQTEFQREITVTREKLIALEAGFQEEARKLKAKQVEKLTDQLLTLSQETKKRGAEWQPIARAHGLPEAPADAVASLAEAMTKTLSLNHVAELERLGTSHERLSQRADDVRRQRADRREAYRQFQRAFQDFERRAREMPSARVQFRAEAEALRKLFVELQTIVAGDTLEKPWLELHQQFTLSDRDPGSALAGVSSALSKLVEMTPSTEMLRKQAIEQTQTSIRNLEAILREWDSKDPGPRLESLVWPTPPTLPSRRLAIHRLRDTALQDLRAKSRDDARLAVRRCKEQYEALAQELEGKVPRDHEASQLALDWRQFAEKPTPDRQRQLVARLSTLSAGKYASLWLEAESLARGPNHAATATSLNTLAQALAGDESDSVRLKRLQTEWRDFASKHPTTPTIASSADWQRRTRLLADELEDTRVGAGASVRKATLDLLRKTSPNTPEMLRERREAITTNLATIQTMAPQHTVWHGPWGETEASRLIRLDAAGHWPMAADAEGFLGVARELRSLRDGFAEVLSQASRWPTTPDGALKTLFETQESYRHEAVEQERRFRSLLDRLPVSGRAEKDVSTWKTAFTAYEKLPTTWRELRDETTLNRVEASAKSRTQLIEQLGKVQAELAKLTVPLTAKKEHITAGRALLRAQSLLTPKSGEPFLQALREAADSLIP
ncbi:MAG: hypothetical protein ACRC8S_21950 [Fimbriiglobus sp.]